MTAILERDVSPAISGGRIVTDEVIAQLPPAIQRYLRFAGVAGRPVPATVSLTQRGQMRLRPGWPWMPFVAWQTYTTAPPGFVWEARLKPLPFWTVRGRDAFIDGAGRMEVWATPFLKVVDASGPELDQGEILRFLGELPWLPAAFTLPGLRWEAIDDGTARATMTVGDTSASVVFHVAPNGGITEAAAERYWAGGNGPARLTPWSGTFADYREVNGVRLPTHARVTWHLPEGDYAYFRARITNVRAATDAAPDPARNVGAGAGP
jgi:hypothetical protein